MKREPLEIERLIRDDQRFTIADHEKWQADLRASQARPAPTDELDDALADPIFDRLPERRSSKATSHLFYLLDSLERREG
jgi:hypothetical protein